MIDSAKWQFARYLLVGIWNTLFGYVMFVLFNHLLTPVIHNQYFTAITASVLGNIAGITNAFIGYKYIVFKSRGNFLREYLRCYLVYGAAIAVNLLALPLLMALLNRYLAVHPMTLFPSSKLQFILDTSQSANIAAAMLISVTVTMSYFGHRNFSFKKEKTL